MNCKYKPSIECEGDCTIDCIINVLTEVYFDRYAFKTEGWYNEFQTTDIWKKAKEYLLSNQKKPLICEFCNEEIKNTPILHHKTYDYGSFFSNEYICFVHSECHSKHHEIYGVDEWDNLPDKWYDIFILGIKSCKNCDKQIEGNYNLCKKCYYEMKGWNYR